MVSAVYVWSLIASAPAVGGGVDDRKRPLKRLVVIAGHFGNEVRPMTGANVALSNLHVELSPLRLKNSL